MRKRRKWRRIPNQALKENTPKAAKELEKSGCNVAKLTTERIKALLYKVYSVEMSGSKLRKQDYIKVLQKDLEQSIGDLVFVHR